MRGRLERNMPQDWKGWSPQEVMRDLLVDLGGTAESYSWKVFAGEKEKAE